MIFLIIIHLLGSAPLLTGGIGHPYEDRQREFRAFMDRSIPDPVESTGGLRMTEKPMPSMEYCEKFVARLPTDKGTLLYCVDVGRNGTFQ